MTAAADPTPGAADLLDDLLPRWDVRSRHQLDVGAPVADTWDALTEDDILSGSFITGLLLRLRGLGTKRGALRDTMGATGFSILVERPGREIVLGIAGRFWALRETQALRRLPDADTFRRFAEPGWAKAAMTIRLEPLAERSTRVVTETRVACCDAAAGRRFSWYWMLIGPFSGLIRWEMLHGLRRAAEARRQPPC
ncbi:MAG: hypothetical protein KIT14_23055 [bacterium]|nr:hypothetical protein [bacterium]